MRRQHRPKRFFALLAFLIIAPLSLKFIDYIKPAVRIVYQRAAMLSALLSMPEGSIAMLEGRFNSEMFTKEEIGQNEPDLPKPDHASTPQQETSDNSTSDTGEKDIPNEYRGKILEENLAGYDSSVYIKYKSSYIRNYTKLNAAQILSHLSKSLNIKLEKSSVPQVLIIHTHATEAFEPLDSAYYDKRYNWRTTDNNNNMVAIGSKLTQVLEDTGINVIHDTAQYDYPSYNSSYERSAKSIKAYTAKYPSIKIVLDLHRDAIEREGSLIVKPTISVNSKKAAQVMIIAGCDDGTMNMSQWSQNFRFAMAINNSVNSKYTDLMRPVMLCYRKYNMDLSSGSLLIEFGGHANTLEECLYSTELLGPVLADLIKSLEG